jgi:hypothetical protein
VAYSSPASTHNPSPGAVIPSSWGDAVNAATDYLATNKPRARVYNSANISVANNTVQALTFNSERYDVGGAHSTVTNTGRLTVPTGEGGLYTMGGTVGWAANVTGRRILLVRVNGTTTICQSESMVDAGTGNSSDTINCEHALAAGDYVELCVFQTSGAALNVTTIANSSPEFWFRWVAT